MFRPIPFWSWNDKLEADKLKHQIREMKKAGMGGYFMHARGGLKTDYLSDDWFECIKESVEEGKKLGLNSWAYDEEGWPSGFAGGRVTALGDDFRAKKLLYCIKPYKDAKNIKNIIGVYKLNGVEYKQLDYTPDGDEEVFIAYIVINEYYIDVCSKKAVDVFISETHEKYYERMPEYFGNYLKGFFTDEPRFVTTGLGDLPWSYEFEDEFLAAYSYCLRDCLPALFLELKDYKKIRYDFWKLVNNMFVNNFMKNVYDWCEAHNCMLTGHIMAEESIYSQMAYTGGVMPTYEYFHIPGIDWLRRRTGNPVTPKQVGSAAAQLGKKQVITESFALCGWDVTFEELKWIAQWQFVNGVNMVCQHLQAYSLRGFRKRDYPPSLFTQQTWWDDYKIFNDFLTETGETLSEGKHAAEVLLLHPMRSGWVCYDGNRNDKIKEIDNSFAELSTYLSGHHIDYHYGDEEIIKKHGSIQDRKFIIGECAYSTVLLSSGYALDGNTTILLNEFINAGGLVVCLGRFPDFTNGSDAELDYIRNKCVKTELSGLYALLTSNGLDKINISDKNGEIQDIFYQRRFCNDYDILYMVNNSREKTFSADIRVDKNACFKLMFYPMQSHLLYLDKETGLPKNAPLAEPLGIDKIYPSENWDIDEMSLNTYTLDNCTYRADNGPWEDKISVIALMNKLLELKREVKVDMRFTFETDYKNINELYVVIEDAEGFEICVNGNIVPYADAGYFKDEAFKKVDIRKHIINGENEIILSKNFYQSPHVYNVLFGENVYETERNKLTYDTELESIYLLGDFGVYSKSGYKERERGAMETNGGFILTDAPKSFTSNNFTVQGLCFFAGDITISQIIKTDGEQPVVLKLPKPCAPLVKVYVNGEFAGDILWAPYEVDITKYVIKGENKITLKLYASNRNMLGPHHHINGELYNVGPESFTGKWSWVERKSEAGLDDDVDMSANFWTDTYCFVKFGFASL